MGKKVSIVIIGRNEEQTISRCIEASVAAAEQIGGAEMIYVDSRSTDNTVSVVEKYKFRSVTLPSHMRLSPSAGRYFGSQVARGEFVLFIDADTLIYKDFLPTALRLLELDHSLGGCNGKIDDFTEAGDPVVDVEEPCDSETYVKWLRGPCCFYRRGALKQVGSFDPELAMEEEAELGLRIVKSGWRLMKIPQPMACHTRCYHGDSIGSVVSTFRRDLRTKRLGEITRTISRAFQAGNGLAFCWLRLRTTILFFLWLVIVTASLFLPSFLYPWAVAGTLSILGILALCVKKKSLGQALVFIPSKILNVVDILSGLHKIEIRKLRLNTSEIGDG